MDSVVKTKRLSGIPQLETVSLALLVMFVVFSFRVEMHSTALPLAIETILLMMLPLGLLAGILKRKDFETLDCKSWFYLLQVMAVAFALLPVFMQFVWLSFDLADPNEIVVLCMVAQLTWFLAVFSSLEKFERTSFVTGASLILFVCFMSQSPTIYAFAFLYSILALWWLFGNYWGKVSTKAIDGQTRTLPIRGATIGIALGVLVIVGLIASAVGPSDRVTSVRGFMPTSGGESWTDDFARSGIGDGDMLTAGQDASTTGAVDSNQFIEDHRPSMYDISSEIFDAPMEIKKKRQNRAQALDATAKHMHQVIQSEQAGRSFRTVRKQRKNNRKLENRITEGLFFVEGPVPARFATECFHHFDGWDWSKVDLGDGRLANPRIDLEQSGGKPWYVVKSQSRQFLETRRAHRVKIMRLDTSTLPATPMIKSWHIHRVEMDDLFEWNKQGIVRMKGEMIPSQTVIDMFSKVPNYYVLQNSANPLASIETPSSWWQFVDSLLGVRSGNGAAGGRFEPLETDANSPYVQMPENETRQRIKTLVNDWTARHQPGWQQVDAIVQKLRSEFRCAPELTAFDDGRDSVASFLDQRGGTTYQFASVATQMLRAAGYRTRLMRGFLITNQDYDSVAKQTVVDSENLHMWPEVCLDGWHWIPVEPTPGYPRPVNSMTPWQWVKTKVADGINWIVYHPWTSSISMLLLGMSFWFRRNLYSAFFWCNWLLQTSLFPQRRLAATRRLLDLQFWVAGLPRPSFSTITHWCSQFEDTSSLPFFELWQSDNFSSQKEAVVAKQVSAACWQVVDTFSLRRIRDFTRTTKTKA